MIPLLIESALRALVVAFTVWAGLRLFRVGNVPAQKIAWGLVLACAVAMPMAMRWPGLQGLLTVRVPGTLWRATPKKSSSAEAAPQTAIRMVADPGARQAKSFLSNEPASTAGDRFPAPVISASQLSAASSEQPAEGLPAAGSIAIQDALRDATLRLKRPGVLAGALYLAVCAILLMRMIYGLAMALRLWLIAERFEPEPGPDPERDPGLGLRLRFSFAVSSPVTIGSGVLLPSDCLGWDREKLRIVLAHERAHVRQGDFYLQLAAGLYAAVFWFSPLGWWLKRTLSDLGEAISDRAGLEEAASRISYAQVLLEFAVLPRPTLIGVAMARSSNLSQRMERFLNESSFSQAFAGGRRRMLLAVLLVPIALFMGTALVRVEAASGQAVPAPALAPKPASAPAPAAAPVAPETGDDLAAPVPDAPASPPDAAQAPQAVPAPAAAPNPAATPAPPEPTEAREADDEHDVNINNSQDDAVSNTNTVSNGKHLGTSVGRGYSYSYSSDGDSWALVTDPGDHVTFSGDWQNSTRQELDKARKMAGGKFLWFTHNGKSYFLNDTTVMAQIQGMYRPMEELGRQQEILGKQQEALGREQEEMGRRQEQASVPTPDISKEMARLNEAVAKLDAKKGSKVSQEELAEIEGRLGEIQGRLGALQGEMGAKHGELGALQGKLGEQQGKLGEEQGRLGEQQGKLAEEANRKVKSIIDESLRDGKAKPVE